MIQNRSRCSSWPGSSSAVNLGPGQRSAAQGAYFVGEAHDFYIGDDPLTTAGLTGAIDEVQLHSVARSADWISAVDDDCAGNRGLEGDGQRLRSAGGNDNRFTIGARFNQHRIARLGEGGGL